MKKINIFVYIFGIIILQFLCASLWASEAKIGLLQNQISALESQKSRLEAQKQELTAKGDELSYKIESLKMQSSTGLGIVGKHRLSKLLREAQALSEKIQALEKDIYNVNNELISKKKELDKEYENQISILIANLDKTKIPSEQRQTLEKLNKYRTEKGKLEEYSKQQLEYLDIKEIAIKEHDSSKDIREKADLINDYSTKLKDGIAFLTNRIEKLKTERKTRIKLGEFAEEISFFGERVSKEEVTANVATKATEKSSKESLEKSDVMEVDTLVRSNGTTSQPATSDTPTADQQVERPGRMVIERNGISADFSDSPMDRLEKEIKLLEGRKQELEKEKNRLSEKAKSFYKKADEIEKSETKTRSKRR